MRPELERPAALLALTGIGILALVVFGPELRRWATPDRPPVLPRADRFESDPENLCYLLDRRLLAKITPEAEFSGPWRASGRDVNFPGGTEAAKSMNCEAVRTRVVNEEEVTVLLVFNSEKSSAPIRGKDFPVTDRFGWNRSRVPEPIPAAWGTGGVSATGDGVIRRSCPTNAYYEIKISVIGRDFPKSSAAMANNARNLLEAAMKRADAMPFCSGQD